MEGYISWGEFIIGDAYTSQVMKNEHGEPMVFKSREAASAYLDVAQSFGFWIRAIPTPYNHKVEASDN